MPSCGTFAAVGGTLYGPTVSLGPTTTAWTFVSQSPAPTGAGTAASPFVITTVETLGTSGIQLTQQDTYITGNTYYVTLMTFKNNGAAPQAVKVWRGIDCYVGPPAQNYDPNYGWVGTTPGVTDVACTRDPNLLTTPIYIRWRSQLGGAQYYEDSYSNVWRLIGSQTLFPNTCLCATSQDGAEGLSWSFTLNAGQSMTVDHCMEYQATISGMPCILPLLCDPISATVTTGTPVQLNATGGDGSYSWSNGATGASTTVTYTSAGTYSVTVTDGTGQTATCTITVIPPELACNPATQTVTRPATLGFTLSGGQSPYSWISPGGTPVGTPPPASATYTRYSTSYTVAGSYIVTAQDSANQSASCQVTVNDPPLVCDPSTQDVLTDDYAHFSATGGNDRYSWSAPSGADPPDGRAYQFATKYPTAGTYDVRVVSGYQTEICRLVVHPRPQSQFAASSVPSCTSFRVWFQDTTRLGDFPIASWYWEFGDGYTSLDQNPYHDYGHAGTYRVTLMVRDAQGTSSTWSGPVTIADRPCAGNDEPPQEPGRGPSAPRDGQDPAIAALDFDNDGIPDASDNCPRVGNGDQADLDHDRIGDLCDPDRDGDGIKNLGDNCPDLANPLQADLDKDSVGDACDDDLDGDAVPNASDNCAQIPNSDQADANGDLIGDACQKAALQAQPLAGATGKDRLTARTAAGVAGAPSTAAQNSMAAWVSLVAAGVVGSAVILLAALRRRE